jgi:rare lipoprotein A (peptidoglycan hydrolase)
MGVLALAFVPLTPDTLSTGLPVLAAAGATFAMVEGDALEGISEPAEVGGDWVRLASAAIPEAPPDGSACGLATWYRRDGLVAAHRALPPGTEVTVHNPENGARVTVVINARGPWTQGRIIDLSDDAFATLAPLAEGVVDVCLGW